MIRIGELFETHLTVSDLGRSMRFFGETLGFKLAQVVPERKVAFYWIGKPGQSMLGLWETGSSPQRMSLHLAFTVDLNDLLEAPEELRRAGVTPLDFAGNPTTEPVVLAWMPAGSLYFHDPDGNLLEFLTMLPDKPAPERFRTAASIHSSSRLPISVHLRLHKIDCFVRDQLLDAI